MPSPTHFEGSHFLLMPPPTRFEGNHFLLVPCHTHFEGNISCLCLLPPILKEVISC